MLVLIDNGHGRGTAGKRSPDSRLLEWAWNRDVAQIVKDYLNYLGIPAKILVPEDTDISLSKRVIRANDAYNEDKSAILVSIHVNAAGDGKEWKSATGWSCYTSKGKTKSDTLAECMYKYADEVWGGKRRVRKDKSDGDSDWEENFTILAKTKCPAVLVENFFMDNHDDCEYLLSPMGQIECAHVIAKGIAEYYKQLKTN